MTDELYSPAALSPRFVRPLLPSEGVPRPRPHSNEECAQGLLPPDTPPLTSPSASTYDSDRSSLSAMSFHQEAVVMTSCGSTHARQISQTSAVVPDTIFEDDRENASPQRPDTVVSFSPICEIVDLPSSESPVKARETTGIHVQTDRQSPKTFVVSFASKPVVEEKEWLGAELDGLMDDEKTQATLRGWYDFQYEAEAEIRRSQTTWADTPHSRDIVARGSKIRM